MVNPWKVARARSLGVDLHRQAGRASRVRPQHKAQGGAKSPWGCSRRKVGLANVKGQGVAADVDPRRRSRIDGRDAEVVGRRRSSAYGYGVHVPSTRLLSRIDERRMNHRDQRLPRTDVGPCVADGDVALDERIRRRRNRSVHRDAELGQVCILGDPGPRRSLHVGFGRRNGRSDPCMKGATGAGISQNANLAKFSVSVDGAIPTTPDAFIQGNIAVGYAWADVSTGKALVAVIHPSFVDSRQQPSGWHVHTVTVRGGATSPNDFCVASVDSAPTAGIDVSGNTLTLNIRQSNLPSGETPGTLSTVVSFTLQSDAGCASGLAVQINT